VQGYTLAQCKLVISNAIEKNTGIYKFEFHDLLNQFIFYELGILTVSPWKSSSTEFNKYEYGDKNKVHFQSNFVNLESLMKLGLRNE